MLAKLRTIVDDPRTERVIMTLIIINAVILGLQTYQSGDDRAGDRSWSSSTTSSSGDLRRRDHGAHHRPPHGRSSAIPWSVFDFVVVAIALVPASQTFTVLRALRILRALRLISAVPTLQGAWSPGCSPHCPAWARSCF